MRASSFRFNLIKLIENVSGCVMNDSRCQIHPVDSSKLHEVRRAEGGESLLTCSGIIGMEWTSENFKKPITVRTSEIHPITLNNVLM